MSKFYGMVRGAAKTTATRRGHSTTGITTTAASWAGAIRVELYVNDAGKECYSVVQTPWHGQGTSKHIASGIVGEA